MIPQERIDIEQQLLAASRAIGSLFAEQVRERQRSFPILEMSGEPGTGKSSLIEFLWTLCGRSGDPGKAAAKYRARITCSSQYLI